MPAPRLYLIDTFGFIFRAYHARARSGAPPMRTSTGIPTEAVLIFNNMVRKLARVHDPAFIAAIFESDGPTLREQEYAEYKANRSETPPDLLEQIPWVRKLLSALSIPILEYPGFEADDVIGTISRRSEAAGVDVVIVSSDKDMLQLVDSHVFMLNPAKDDEWYDSAKVREFMGVDPGQVRDLLALKGDPVDNIPGAPGIGEKGARDLLAEFGSLDALLERAAEVPRKAYRESLQNSREQILLSKRLATIETAVPIEFSLEAVASRPPDETALKQVYKDLEFYASLRELGPGDDSRPRSYVVFDAGEAIPRGAPIALAISRPSREDLPMHDAFLPSIGLAWKPGEARAVPATMVEELRTMVEDAGRVKIVADVKSALMAFEELRMRPAGFSEDILLYAFLLDADPGACSLAELTRRRLDLKPATAPEQLADYTLELWPKLRAEVDARGLRPVYEELDLPCAPVLARMEQAGIRIDSTELGRLSTLMGASIERLTGEIHALAGHPFNVASPQQLSRVLFDELKLPPPPRQAKGKPVSTAADVLEDLAADHEIVRKVLEFRQLSKLKGTYVDALPALVKPETGRLHTSFNQAGAATGRLSSSNPNLQNIPIRTEMGREIRAAFVPREGWKMVVADYSQIELRLLAHLSRDPVLLDAFRNGEDIHERTAAEVFGVPPLMVTSEQRRNAKAVNFGIVYGISGFGLAAQLGITRAEADAYIKSYFERYRGVKRFIDATIEEVRRTGVTRTIFGRERPIPDMNSRNPAARGFAERTAVNSPLQGSAADLIKLAMIRIDRRLREERYQGAMLLQVHDELVFEAPPEETEALRRMVKQEMEGARKLEVPLLVDVGVGDNWRDA